MHLKHIALTKSEIFVLLTGLIALLTIIALVQRPPFYDETAYLENVSLINQYGLSEQYLLNHKGSAGPLYSVVHYLLQPITHLKAPQLRFVNLGFLLGTICFIGLTLKSLGFSKNLALTVLAIPMTYVISGLALTEMPSIFFLSLGLYIVVQASYSKQMGWVAILKLIVAGLAFGLAIVGRQPFLLILSAVPILFFDKTNYSRTIIFTIVTIVSAVVIPGYVFFIWQGLIAPSETTFYPDQGAVDSFSFRLDFFLLCIAYYAIIFLIIAPRFYIKPSKGQVYFLLASFILFTIFNSIYKTVIFLPFYFILERTFPPFIINALSILSGAVFMIMALYFLLALYTNLQAHRYQKQLLFYSAAIFLVAVGCGKISWGFSSRYPAQALPFIIPVCAFFYTSGKYSVVRLAIGVILGLSSLASYLFS